MIIFDMARSRRAMKDRDYREDYPVEYFWEQLRRVLAKSDEKHRLAQQKLEKQRRERRRSSGEYR